MARVLPEDAHAVERSNPPTAFGTGVPERTQHRAEPPRAPALPSAALKAKAEHRAYVRSREALERRSILRGLILLALVVLVIALIRAGTGRAFPAGWLHRW